MPISLENCHCKGLVSIVLRDRISDKSGMIRIFVAREDHELWKNTLNGEEDWSIGLHGHHCDLTMVPLFGDVVNIFEPTNLPKNLSNHKKPKLLQLKEYEYISAISDGKAKFIYKDSCVIPLVTYSLDEPTFLTAFVHHSVYVPKGKSAAWMIIEQEECEEHRNETWSNANLENFDDSELYKQISFDRLSEDITLLAANGGYGC